MSPFQRDGRAVYYLDLRWRGYPRLKLSTDTTIKRRAQDMERTLYALRRAGRRDLLELLARRRLRLPDVHDAYTRDPATLEQLKARAESPALGELVDRWLAYLRSPAGVSPRTKRRYTPGSVNRYAYSWAGFFSVLPRGRDATLGDVTRGFILEYRRTRVRAVGGRRRQERPDRPISAATLNRDLAALGAFLTWAREVEGLTVERPKMAREREGRGRERWLSAEELARFTTECPAEWWPLFATLFYTGGRLGEAQGLRGADILLQARRILIHERERRVKTREAVRDLVFPGAFQDYGQVRRTWRAICAAAKITGATPHDARHTFAVHATQAGVPVVRLQKLLGHATALMTMRYMKHAPEAYLDQDAAVIADHLTGTDTEAAARVDAARREIRPA